MKYLYLLMLFSTSLAAEVNWVKVDKSERRLYLMDGEKVVKDYHIALGDNPKGHKQREGDEKTPEGTYWLDYKKEDSRVGRDYDQMQPLRL